MENCAVPVLGVRDNARGPQWQTGVALISAHINLKAAAIATTVNARLIHGPQKMTPTIMVSAKRGKNDLPNTRPVDDKNLCVGRLILGSFLLTLAMRCVWKQRMPGDGLVPTRMLSRVAEVFAA